MHGIQLNFLYVYKLNPHLSVMNLNIIILSHLSQYSTSVTSVLSLFVLPSNLSSSIVCLHPTFTLAHFS